MTLEEFLASLIQDKVAVIFFFLLLPMLVMGLNKYFPKRGDQGGVAYVYSTIVYASCIPGVVSACVWLYSMIFDEKSLLDLDPFIYYLPPISTIGTLMLVQQNVRLKVLPWFGEFYELLALIFVSFWVILLTLRANLLPFKAFWQVFLLFIIIFIALKLFWDQFEVRMLRRTRPR